MASADMREELICPVCINVFTDPVALPCGHNFCQECIRAMLDSWGTSEAFTCPECRVEFKDQPVLQRNRKLKNIVERFLFKYRDEDESGISCTYCIQSKVTAAKFCVCCEAFLCYRHLRVHNKSEEHVLTEPTTSPISRRCSVHKKLLEFYCSEDDTCICSFCYMFGEHRGHTVEQMSKISEKKKEKLRTVLKKLKPDKGENEQRLQLLQEQITGFKQKASFATRRVGTVFEKIEEQQKALKILVLKEIAQQEVREVCKFSGSIQNLEVKNDHLSQKIHHVEELVNNADPATILQEFKTAVDTFSHPEEGNNEERDGDDKNILSAEELGDNLISVELLKGLAGIVSNINIWWVYGEEGKDMILDTRTAGNNVAISEDMKTASWSVIDLNRPESPERFHCAQVFSIMTFNSGFHYWDMEVSELGGWSLGVAYPSIEREGNQSWIGNNNRSWSLYRYNDRYSVRHNSEATKLPHSPSCRKIRISLDYEVGRLSFYELGDPIRHLHTFCVSFKEPVHPVFRVGWMGNAWVRIISSGTEQQ
ncbi:hypothetical protein GDO86_010660 [Hymenochirus boettgeri]|uniref:Uncharacterized protein n=1 Tax=Hymenochirus boettgeri TaxID=247094 RepID=A0A8T2JG47_9PIPI|nr:hypothetical protein GDO86_010660 [Hymenochirus boettgeri]